VLAHTVVALLAAILSSAALDEPSRAAPLGSLRQLDGKAGCVRQSASRHCSRGRGIADALDVVVSPDGRNVYVASFRSLAVFARDPRSGALHQLTGKRGCVAVTALQGCAHARRLREPESVAVSPDGRNVYVGAGADALVVFARNPHTGELRQPAGRAGCFSRRRLERCASVRGLDGGEDVAVSADGRSVYVASAVEDSEALTTFARDPRTGLLRQLPGADGCVSAVAHPGCGRARGLENAASVALPGDGRHVYVAGRNGTLVAFARDPLSGALVQLDGTAGCSAEPKRVGCASARGLSRADDVTVSPDGENLYVGSLDDGAKGHAIAVFARDRQTGTLRQRAGRRGCVNASGAQRCTRAGGLAGRRAESILAVTVSPDGRRVYASSAEEGGFLGGAIVVLARGPRTGALRQLSGSHGCIASERRRAACTRVRGLQAASTLAMSPDGQHAYVAAADAVTAFRVGTQAPPPGLGGQR
jgi:DNA-binding beta-propeller fold protein YncE